MMQRAEHDPPIPVPEPARWRQLASTAGDELRERIARNMKLSDRDREKLVLRLRNVIEMALEVPPDLPWRIARDARRLRQAAGADADVVDIAWARTRQRARRTAAIGTVTTIPVVVPVLGPPLAALGLVADWRYAAEQQRDLVLEIAALFGVMPADPTPQIRGLFLASTATAFGSSAAGDALVKVLGRQIARRSVSRLVPGAGAVAAGALNYVATATLGRLAIRHFAARAGIEVRGAIPERVHPAMPWLRNATLHAFEDGDVLAGVRPPFAEADRDVITALAAADREELLDLAITAAGGEGRGEHERVLASVGSALGFDAGAIDHARASTTAEITSAARRVARLVASAGTTGPAYAQKLWRRAGSLARRGARRVRRNIPKPPRLRSRD